MESGFTGTGGEEGDGLVDSPQWGDIDSLSSNSSLGTDSGRVLTGSSVDDSVDEDLNGVLLGNEVDDLESVLNNSDSHDLLSVVSAVHHECVDESLDNGHSALGELLLGVSTGSVGSVDSVADIDVVGQRDVLDLNVLVVPSSKELYDALVCDLLNLSG